MKQNAEEFEEERASAQTAEAEEEKGAADAVSYGKFKDAEALLKAYESLESEFTRRSQRLRALEGGREKERKGEITDASPSPPEKYGVEDFLREHPRAVGFSEDLKRRSSDLSGKEDILREYVSLIESRLEDGENKLKDRDFLIGKLKADEKAREEIVKEYLRGIVKSKPETDFGGGVAVTAPPHKPKSLEEAGNLARQYIKIKGET